MNNWEPHLSGMGAIPYEGGVAFRVWAPHADYVAVKGDFNWWSDTWNPLHHEAWGYWYGAVPGAVVGQEYKFRIGNSGGGEDKIDPYAYRVTASNGNGIIHAHGWFDWEGDDFVCPPHNDLVVYEVHVGSFEHGWHGRGNFDRLTERIGHFVHLGVNAIELMPIMEFPGDVSWGYNPSCPFAVESSYGGPDAFKRFVRECHKNGIAVLLDVVYNHFGPNDLDLWRFDGWYDNDKGGIYFYNDHRAQTPWGDARPDYGRGEVRQYIRDNALMWMQDYHVDGLRYDMTPYMRSVDGSAAGDLPEGFDLMRWINSQIRDRYPDRLLVAEDMLGDPSLIGMDDGHAGFHAQWDTNFVHPVRAALSTMDDAHRSMPDIAAAITSRYGADAFSRVVFTESHDEAANGSARLTHEIAPFDQHGWWAQKRSTLGAALALTSPGIPMLLMGQEFIQPGEFNDHVGLDWWQNDRYQGIVTLYRDLIALRRNWRGVTRGLLGQGVNVYHLNDDTKVIAFQRWMNHGTGDDVVIVANFSSECRFDYHIGMPAGGHWKLQFNSDWGGYSDAFGGFESYDIHAFEDGQDGMSHHGTFSIAPYSLLIYSWEG